MKVSENLLDSSNIWMDWLDHIYLYLVFHNVKHKCQGN